MLRPIQTTLNYLYLSTTTWIRFQTGDAFHWDESPTCKCKYVTFVVAPYAKAVRCSSISGMHMACRLRSNIVFGLTRDYML